MVSILIKVKECLEKKSSLASLGKVSEWLGFSDLDQGGVSHFLGQGGPPTVATWVALPRCVFPIGSGERCHLFGLGDCLSIDIGGVAEDGCSSTGGVLGDWMSEGNGGACPNTKWYDAASTPLIDCGLWLRVA